MKIKLSEKFIIKILDIANGTNVLKHYKFFHSFLNASPDEIKQYQINQLKLLLEHAYNTVPYYKNEIDKNNIDINSINDLDQLKKLPVLTREIIQKNGEALHSNKFNKKQIVKGSSSGTTGIPMKYLADKNGYSAGFAAGLLLSKMGGYPINKKNVHIWGNKDSIKQWRKYSSRIKSYFIRSKNIASSEFDETNNLSSIFSKIKKFNPNVIDGYSSTIDKLAQFIETEGVRLNKDLIVITTAENLTMSIKERIEKNIGPVSDLYGSGEVLGIAVKPHYSDFYYILDAHVIIETIKSDIEGYYDILLTDLDNYGMPMIRYKIGDMIDGITTSSPDKNFPFSKFKNLLGRASDVIKLENGKNFHPINIFGGTMFRKYPEITKHKVIWNGKELTFLFEASKIANIEKLNQELKELLEPYEVEFKIELVEKLLPSKSGKFKYIEILTD